MADPKHTLPPFLETKVTLEKYRGWLAAKAAAHARRDQGRFASWVSGAKYRDAIHAAVLASNGKDSYTGEELQWEMIGTYNNAESQLGKHQYKAGFALLPTLDHVVADDPAAGFCICAWRTNDSKHDLNTAAFVDLCKKVLEHHGYSVAKPI